MICFCEFFLTESRLFISSLFAFFLFELAVKPEYLSSEEHLTGFRGMILPSAGAGSSSASAAFISALISWLLQLTGLPFLKPPLEAVHLLHHCDHHLHLGAEAGFSWPPQCGGPFPAADLFLEAGQEAGLAGCT